MHAPLPSAAATSNTGNLVPSLKNRRLPLPPGIDEMLSEIRLLEARLPDLTHEENTKLISLLHHTANEIQVAEIRSELRARLITSGFSNPSLLARS